MDSCLDENDEKFIEWLNIVLFMQEFITEKGKILQ